MGLGFFKLGAVLFSPGVASWTLAIVFFWPHRHVSPADSVKKPPSFASSSLSDAAGPGMQGTSFNHWQRELHRCFLVMSLHQHHAVDIITWCTFCLME